MSRRVGASLPLQVAQMFAERASRQPDRVLGGLEDRHPHTSDPRGDTPDEDLRGHRGSVLRGYSKKGSSRRA